MLFTLSRVGAIDPAEVLSAAEAAAHLRVESDDDEALIEAFTAAAIDWVERHSGVSLAVRQWDWLAAGFPGAGRALDLPMGPVVEIEHVKWLDSAAVETTLIESDYRFAGQSLFARAGTVWPVTLAEMGGAAVRFTAGHENASATAPALVAAVKMLLGHLYNNREAVIAGISIAEVPMSVAALCAPYRRIRI